MDLDLDGKLRRYGMEPGTRAANKLLAAYQKNPDVLGELLDREWARLGDGGEASEKLKEGSDDQTL